MADLRIGVVGTGAIGRTHIERINTRLQGAKVIGCSDANIDFCKSVAEKYGIRAYDSGEEMINDPEIDAVICTTIDAFHEQYVMAAIKAEKPVFCEKPLAPKADACKRIVDAEMATGKHLVQVGFMRRYDAGYKQIKAAIDSGEYGAPLLLHCAHRNPSVAVDWTNSSAVENSMIHEIDTLRWLVGENYTSAEVRYGRDSRHTGNDADGKFVHDPQIMILTTESGIRIDVESYVHNCNNYEIRCEVVCEDAVLNLPEPPSITVTAKGAKIRDIDKDWSTRFTEAYNEEIQQWIYTTKEGKVEGPTAWDGYVAQITALSASKARDTQTIVPIDIPEKPEFYK